MPSIQLDVLCARKVISRKTDIFVSFVTRENLVLKKALKETFHYYLYTRHIKFYSFAKFDVSTHYGISKIQIKNNAHTT
jgi:hypothetical protein